MNEETKIKYREYMSICTAVQMKKLKGESASSEERDKILSLREEFAQSHQEIVKTASGILRDDMKQV